VRALPGEVHPKILPSPGADPHMPRVPAAPVRTAGTPGDHSATRGTTSGWRPRGSPT
jgi:hypothetical protein